MKEPNCPKILDCPKDLIVDDGCCKKCEYKCKAHTREKSKTIQLIREQNEHGICLNSEEIPEFMECKGSCPSSYSYNKGKSSYVTECLCCKEKGHKTVSVELVCEDDFRYKTNIKIPVSCSCDLCSAPFAFEYDPSDDNNGLNIRGNTE